jgi:hypothetical protein
MASMKRGEEVVRVWRWSETVGGFGAGEMRCESWRGRGRRILRRRVGCELLQTSIFHTQFFHFFFKHFNLLQVLFTK